MLETSTLSINDITEVGEHFHHVASTASTMEECAGEIVRYLYGNVVDSKGARACALVRCFKTHPLAELPFDIRQAVADADSLTPGTKCLTLLATAGDEPAWNSRRTSASHQAIPLTSRNIIARSPMIAQLIRQFGIDVSDVINPRPGLILDLHERTYNVFYVDNAHGSTHIPAQQQFVIPYRIKSVIGFGGMLASGDLFAVILFAKVEVPRQKAELFQALAVSVKTAFMRFAWGNVFGIRASQQASRPLL